MFEKTLTDIVKGIRASKRDTALYISQCIAEIKTEINSNDMFVKANALQKLTFLQMMGYNMSWASFPTIEVMSSPRFAHKRIGYLAASQGFTQDTEVILLTTNLLQKELRGAVGGGMNGVYEAGLAINCISNIVTEDLARDLLPELTNLITHPQPYLRKKAILCLFKVFVRYPQGLRLTFAKLQKCLEDPNTSVVSSAVNVITELSDKNPRNYLHLAPAFFELLTKSSNNWMLIKVVKLLGSLVPEEPRLARKLLEPLATIVRNTQAKSLLYEAVHTITLCLPYCQKSDGSMPAIVPDIVTLCAQTLRSFVEEPDQNLKYLGLVGFGSLMKSHPRVLSAPDYRPLILACLSDEDVTIRTRALDLLTGMATRKNLIELVTQLMKHVEMATGSYKHNLVAKIVEMASGEKYALLQDFSWYLDVLFHLGHMRGVEVHGRLLRAQISDVALRVLPVRVYAVRRSIEVLLEGEGRIDNDDDDADDMLFGDNGRGKHIMPDILPALAWIIGEYSDLIREAVHGEGGKSEDFSFNESSKGTYHSIVQALTAPSNSERLPTRTQKLFIQAAMKVFAAASAESSCSGSELEAILGTIHAHLPVYAQSTDVEVTERAYTSLELLNSLKLSKGSLLGLTTSSDEGSTVQNGGDLLGMAQGDGGQTKPAAPASTVSGRIRESSSTLNSLLKPEPMKPVGGKTQRKKRASPIGVDSDLDAPVNLAVFENLITEEEILISGSTLTTDAVSFTQQRPLKVEDRSVLASSAPEIDLSSPHAPQPTTQADASHSFQHPGGGITATSTSKNRQGDPFYLNSGPAASEPKPAHQDDSRFGTIQLLDSDDEADEGRKRKKKKEKKAKKAKTPVRDTTNDNLFSFGSNDQNQPAVIIYDSDDDDDQDIAQVPGRRKPGKEFDGLAKVDLTTPLREDEVMPERKHRVVPERPAEPQTTESRDKKKSKKAKKDKKKKKYESEPGNTTGDLLGLGGFDPIPAQKPTAAAAATATPSNDVNPINAAFDDLLSLANPTPAAPQQTSNGGLSGLSSFVPNNPAPAAAPSTSMPSATAPSNDTTTPWLKASLKLANASGHSTIDWANMFLLYRVHPVTSATAKAVSLSLRFQNNSAQSHVNGVSVNLKGSNAIVEFGMVGPGSFADGSTANGSTSSTHGTIGPFTYKLVDSSVDVKGVLECPTGNGTFSVPVKLSLPPTVFLCPPSPPVSLDTVAQELSQSQQWSSHSAKIGIVSGHQSPAHIQQVLCDFLHAQNVTNNINHHPSINGTTLAAYSSATNAQVRVLIKVKEGSVKVDLKCTSESLGKALASDLKKLVL